MVNSRSRQSFTIADVAKAAGVSKTQAARALGGYGYVSQELRTRVEAAAVRLEYSANQLARSMATGRTRMIGVVVGDIENPYFSIATRGISDAVRDEGYRVLVANSDELLKQEETSIKSMLDSQVDGLIVSPCSPKSVDKLNSVLDLGKPLVLLDRYAPGLDADVVHCSFSEATTQAVNLLIEKGHRRVVYMSGRRLDNAPLHADREDFSPVGRRMSDIAACFERRGLSFDRNDLIMGVETESDVLEILKEMFAQETVPTAIIASSSAIGIKIIKCMRNLSLEIPRDVSFLMYDNSDWSEIITPAISVISQPVYEIGYEAGKLLLSKMEGEEYLNKSFKASFYDRESIAESK